MQALLCLANTCQTLINFCFRDLVDQLAATIFDSVYLGVKVE